MACRQAIIWTNAGILLIGPFRINFSEISIKNSNIFIQENFKMSPGKWRPCCLGLYVLIDGKHIGFRYWWRNIYCLIMGQVDRLWFITKLLYSYHVTFRLNRSSAWHYQAHTITKVCIHTIRNLSFEMLACLMHIKLFGWPVLTDVRSEFEF